MDVSFTLDNGTLGGWTPPFAVHVRPECEGINAVPRAAAVLDELAPVSTVACTAPHPRHEAS